MTKPLTKTKPEKRSGPATGADIRNMRPFCQIFTGFSQFATHCVVDLSRTNKGKAAA